MNIRKVSLYLAGMLLLFFTWHPPRPAHAQTTTTPYDCNFTFSFTGTGAQTGVPNSTASRPCVAWRYTYTTTGFSTVTVQFETSPDNITYTAVPNTICSSSVQPPCLTDGASPTTGAQGTAAIRAYGKYVRINVTSVTSSGSGTVVVFGYKGTTASANTGGGGGGVGPTGPTGPAGTTQHTIAIPISGAPIGTGTGSVGIPGSANYSCTINKAQIVGNASGSITVDIWKAAGAIPSSGNKISASAPVTLSTAQLNQNSPLTSWTTTVTANDVFWASVATVDGSLNSVGITLTCQ